MIRLAPDTLEPIIISKDHKNLLSGDFTQPRSEAHPNDIMILDRRQALLTTTTFLSSVPLAKELLGYIDINKCSDLICNSTPFSLREAVKGEDLFLYRGNDIPLDDVPRLIDPEPDLLMEPTYGDPYALKYFECLEHRLDAFPANHQRGTSQPPIKQKLGNGERRSLFGHLVPTGHTFGRKTRIFSFPPNGKIIVRAPSLY